MGILEPGFNVLHWPPLVRNVVQTTQFPGYRYEFFRSFKELDAYFTEQIGKDWRNESWAEFWINQHLETKNDDRQQFQEKPVNSPIRTKRREMPDITAVAVAYLNEHPKTSSYKLVTYLKTQNIHITQNPAWRIIKKWKTAPDTLRLDQATGKYLSTGYTQNTVTPTGEQIPEGYTREQWRKDWNKKHGLAG